MAKPPDAKLERTLPFVMIPAWMVLDPNVSDEEVGAFARLTYFAGSKATCYPTEVQLAAMSGRSERRERTVLKKLADLGAVTRTRLKRTGDGYKAGTEYDLSPAWSESHRTKTSGQDITVSTQDSDEAQVTGRFRPLNKKYIEIDLGDTFCKYGDRTKTSGDSERDAASWVGAIQRGESIYDAPRDLLQAIIDAAKQRGFARIVDMGIDRLCGLPDPSSDRPA